MRIWSAQFLVSSCDSTLDKKGKRIVGWFVRKSWVRRHREHEWPAKMPLPRIVTEKFVSHIMSRGKGVQLLPFLNFKKRNFGLKEELHGC